MDIQKRAVEITAELVKIKSITFAELNAARYIKEFLSGLGFDAAIDEANNVVGELKGKGGGPPPVFPRPSRHGRGGGALPVEA